MYVIDIIKSVSGVLILFSQAISTLAFTNVGDIIRNGLTFHLYNPFGYSPNFSLPSWGDFGSELIAIFESIPGVSFDFTTLEFMFFLAVVTIIVRIIKSVLFTN